MSEVDLLAQRSSDEPPAQWKMKIPRQELPRAQQFVVPFHHRSGPSVPFLLPEEPSWNH